jgi:SM-20-related protein
MEWVSPNNPTRYSQIGNELGEKGWCVTPNFFSDHLISALAEESWELWRNEAFRHARVGYEENRQLRTEVRTDRVLWLENAQLTPAQQSYFDALEQLRLEINRMLFLGLFEFEGHLTVYPSGSYYRKHLDQFRGVKHRVVSCILYLNSNWGETDGGQLRIYLSENEAENYVDVLPCGGTLVSFLSEKFYHEVLPAQRDRLSLTGWFKTRK